MNCKGDEDVDAKRSRPSIGKPAMGHARKERVLLIGTDQRITSGPAAKRLHSKAGYMAAPERFAKKSDSFPLHRGRRPYMTHLRHRRLRTFAVQKNCSYFGKACYRSSLGSLRAGRVAWQSTSNGESSLARLTARQQLGRSLRV